MVAASAQRSIRFDRHVPGFAAHTVGAVPHFPIKDDSVADAGAQSQHAKRIDAEIFSQTQGVLRQCREVGIALEHHRAR